MTNGSQSQNSFHGRSSEALMREAKALPWGDPLLNAALDDLLQLAPARASCAIAEAAEICAAVGTVLPSPGLLETPLQLAAEIYATARAMHEHHPQFRAALQRVEAAAKALNQTDSQYAHIQRTVTRAREALASCEERQTKIRGELYRRHNVALIQNLHRRGYSDPDDIAHEAWCKMYTEETKAFSPSDPDPGRPFFPWLIVIAHHIAIDRKPPKPPPPPVRVPLQPEAVCLTKEFAEVYIAFVLRDFQQLTRIRRHIVFRRYWPMHATQGELTAELTNFDATCPNWDWYVHRLVDTLLAFDTPRSVCEVAAALAEVEMRELVGEGLLKQGTTTMDGVVRRICDRFRDGLRDEMRARGFELP